MARMLGRCLASPALYNIIRSIPSRFIVHVIPENLHGCVGQDLLYCCEQASCSIPVQVWLLQDRLCYAVSGAEDRIRYVPLDRITVRPLPRGYTPRIAVMRSDEAMAVLPGRMERHSALGDSFGMIFSMQYGSKTAFWAAASSQEAKACCIPSMSTSCIPRCLQCDLWF